MRSASSTSRSASSNSSQLDRRARAPDEQRRAAGSARHAAGGRSTRPARAPAPAGSAAARSRRARRPPASTPPARTAARRPRSASRSATSVSAASRPASANAAGSSVRNCCISSERMQLVAAVHRRLVGVLRDEQHARRRLAQQPLAVAAARDVVAERGRPDRQQRDLRAGTRAGPPARSPAPRRARSRPATARRSARRCCRRRRRVSPSTSARRGIASVAPAPRISAAAHPSVRSNSVSASSSETARPSDAEQLAYLARREREVRRADRRHLAARDEPRERRHRRPRARRHDDVQVLRRALQQVAERLHDRRRRRLDGVHVVEHEHDVVVLLGDRVDSTVATVRGCQKRSSPSCDVDVEAQPQRATRQRARTPAARRPRRRARPRRRRSRTSRASRRRASSCRSRRARR